MVCYLGGMVVLFGGYGSEIATALGLAYPAARRYNT